MAQEHAPRTSLFEPAYYELRVGCELHDRWADSFEGLVLTNMGCGEATLSGLIADQAALHGVLARIRDLGWPLVSVNRVPAPDGLSQAVGNPSGEDKCTRGTPAHHQSDVHTTEGKTQK